jgi:hypothetical protein
MRKLFWCCTAAGVVAAGGIYTAARHGCCPQVVVSTVTAAGLHVFPPLARLGVAAGRYARGPAAEETLTRDARDEAAVPDEPRPVLAAETNRPAPAPIVIAEEEPELCRPLDPEACEPPRPECAVAPMATGSLCPPAIVNGNPGQAPAVECRTEDQFPTCPMVMPYCTDEEAPVEKAPRMPRADEEPALGANAKVQFQFWVEGLKQGKEEQQTNGPAQGDDAPNCQEDEHYYEHYSGCPYTGYHLPSQRCPVTPIDAEPVKRPNQDECSEESAPKKHKVNHPGKSVESEECPAHPDVDTMEYRRSDGGLNEYGPGPF